MLDLSQRKSLLKSLDQVLPKPKLTKYIPDTRTEKQEAFLCLDCLEVFFGGAAGGGKTHALLMSALQYVDVPGYSALIIRRTYPELAAAGNGFIDLSKEWLAKTDAKWNEQKKRWTFPTGGKPATITFEHYETGTRGQQKKFGGQHQFIGVDEVTAFMEAEYRFLFRSLRRPDDMPVPLRMRSASNPIGIGAPFIKQRFIVEGNRTIKENIWGEEIEYERRYIPAKLDDNPFMDRKAYITSLGNMEPHLLQALLNGDWDVKPPGKMFQRHWFEIVVAVPADCWFVRFWDLAATPEDAGGNPSWTVGLKMGTNGKGIFYAADVIRKRLDVKAVKQLVIQTAEADGPYVPVRIEQEGGSSGEAVIQDYISSMPEFDVQGRRPTGPKEVRAVPFANQTGAGNVKLLRGTWNGAYLDEVEQFPSGKAKSDQVDASSGAYNELISGSFLTSGPLIESYGGKEMPDW